ncbi:MAG: LacI family DNA-binding transcriptional regulator [Dehalococcoidia bacterium]
MSTSKRPGIADVARVAGVSHQTVSRVLNGSPAVLESTRTRVLDAMTTLGYRPNASARALASRRSGVIGVLALESTLYGPASTLYAIERSAREAGYFVSVAVVEAGSARGIADALDRLTLQGVEGVVAIVPLVGVSDALSAVAAEIPVVIAQAADAHRGARETVAVDQVHGGELVTSHLLDQGAKNVWHIAGPADWIEAQLRIEGWRRALTARNAPVFEPLLGDWSPASGYRHGLHLGRRDDVDAVFVANDQMALGVLSAFDELGVRVPDDILIAGFDDIPEAAFFSPPLTTVRQDFAAIGRQAIARLLRGIAGAPRDEHTMVAPVLVPRRSSQHAP